MIGKSSSFFRVALYACGRAGTTEYALGPPKLDMLLLARLLSGSLARAG
jgi:hypothetical protein